MIEKTKYLCLVIFLFILMPIKAQELAIEKTLFHSMELYSTNASRYNKEIDKLVEKAKKVTEDYKAFSEIIQTAQIDYERIFLEAKEYDKYLLPAVKKQEFFNQNDLSESRIRRNLSYMSLDKLLVVLGNLQELQKFKMQEIESDNKKKFEDNRNEVFQQFKEYFFRDAKDLDLADLHDFTDLVKNLIRMRSINITPNDFIKKNRDLKPILEIGSSHYTDAYFASIAEKLLILAKKEMEIYSNLKKSLEEYKKNIQIIDSNPLRSLFLSQKRFFSKLGDQISDLEQLKLITRHKKRADIVLEEMKAFFNDVVDDLQEHTEAHQNLADGHLDFYDNKSLSINKIEQIIKEWNKFRRPLGFNYTRKSKYFLDANNTLQKKLSKKIEKYVQSKSLLTFLKVMTSKVYQEFVHGIRNDLGEINSQNGANLEKMILTIPKYMKVPKIYPFKIATQEKIKQTDLNVGEKVNLTSIHLFDLEKNEEIPHGFYLDYSHLPEIMKILDLEYPKLAAIGTTNEGRKVFLRLKLLVNNHKNSPRNYKGKIKDFYNVAWMEKKAIKKKINGKWVDTFRHESKKKKIALGLNIWNLSKIKTILSDAIDFYETGENSFSVLLSENYRGSGIINVKGVYENEGNQVEILSYFTFRNKFRDSTMQKFRFSAPNLFESPQIWTILHDTLDVQAIKLKITPILLNVDVKNTTSSSGNSPGNIFKVTVSAKGAKNIKVKWLSADFEKSKQITDLGSDNWKMPASSNLIVLEIQTPDKKFKITKRVDVDGERIIQPELTFSLPKKKSKRIVIPKRYFKIRISGTIDLTVIRGDVLTLTGDLISSYRFFPPLSKGKIHLKITGNLKEVIPIHLNAQLVKNLKVTWSCPGSDNFNPKESTFYQTPDKRWVTSTKWRVSESLGEQVAVTAELHGNLKGIKLESSKEEQLEMKELEKQLNETNTTLAKKYDDSLEKVLEALKKLQTQQQEIRDEQKKEKEEHERWLQELKRKEQNEIAIKELELKLIEEEEKQFAAEEKILADAEKDISGKEKKEKELPLILDQTFDPELEPRIKYKVVDPTGGTLNVVKLPFQLVFSFKNTIQILKEEIRSAPQNITDEIETTVLSIIRDAPILLVSGIASLDLKKILKAFTKLIGVIKGLKKILKIIKRLNKVAKKIDKLREKFEKIREKFEKIKEKAEEAQELIEKFNSGNLKDLIADTEISSNKKKNRKRKSKKKASKEKFTKKEDKKKINKVLKNTFKNLLEKAKKLSAGIRKKRQKIKQELKKLKSRRKNVKQSLARLKNRKKNRPRPKKKGEIAKENVFTKALTIKKGLPKLPKKAKLLGEPKIKTKIHNEFDRFISKKFKGDKAKKRRWREITEEYTSAKEIGLFVRKYWSFNKKKSGRNVFFAPELQKRIFCFLKGTKIQIGDAFENIENIDVESEVSASKN